MKQSSEDICIVAPFYNEADNLEAFHQRLAQVMKEVGLPWQLLLVDDGSDDESVAIADALRQGNENVGLIRLSRNFGKELALTAGLDHADADAVIVIDSDLQDPPELIPTLLERWREGYDVVFATREQREGESLLKRATAAGFYRIINLMSRTPIPRDTGDFRLLSRRAVEALGKVRERHRFMKGLFAWVGFPQVSVPYQRQARHAGRSKFSYWRLWNFAVDGITSFTSAPLKFATYLGLFTSFVALVYGVVVIAKTLAFGDPVQGYPSMMVVILFLGGVQLMALGVMGEYLARLFDESKQRPLYLLDCYHPANNSSRDLASDGSGGVSLSNQAG